MFAMCAWGTIAATARAQLPPAPAGVQITSQYGIDFSTIGSAGNAPFVPPALDPDRPVQRQPIGTVAYDYRIARTEVTTGQWMEFLNTFAPRIPIGSSNASLVTTFHGGPRFGAGAVLAPGGPGYRWVLRDVPDAAMIPVSGISWVEAAEYCNWLHNGRSDDFAALMSGAYDLSTFTGDALNGYSHQATRSPGARFWIPSVDEWTKAAHFDPDRYGEGMSGWWLYPTRSDAPPVYGRPGFGVANAELFDPLDSYRDIPLGAYPDTMSPWGLLDAAGASREWTEQWDYLRGFSGLPVARTLRGSLAESGVGSGVTYDLIYWFGSSDPYTGSDAGLRIASAVPAPGSCLGFTAAIMTYLSRRRRPLAM